MVGVVVVVSVCCYIELVLCCGVGVFVVVLWCSAVVVLWCGVGGSSVCCFDV